MNDIKWSVVDLERTLTHLDIDKNFSMQMSQELVLCSSPKTKCGGRITDKFFKYNTPVWLGFASNVEKTILRYWSR